MAKARAIASLGEARALMLDGAVSSADLVEASLSHIAETAGEDRAFIRVFETDARASAAAFDQNRGTARPLTGIPISIKDNVDLVEVSATAGSLALEPAHTAADADAAALLRAAGAIIIGHTNMTEFAYSGLGLNPHYGAPRNLFDPSRAPGGSSSGAAVSVARGHVLAALGTDTAGSIRVPAAYCGVVGFKPSRDAISRAGVIALAPSMDCVGVIARTAACCALLHGVLTQSAPPPDTINLAHVRALTPRGWLTDDLHEDIAADFSRAITHLTNAGLRIDQHGFATAPMLDEIETLGGLIAPEAASILSSLPPHSAELIDPMIKARLEQAASIPSEHHQRAMALRARAAAAFDAEFAADILLAPTTAVPPPFLHQLTELDAFKHHNRRVLRNTLPANVLDLPAITLPMHTPGAAPSGLMLIGRRGEDRRLLSIAQAVQRALRALIEKRELPL